MFERFGLSRAIPAEHPTTTGRGLTSTKADGGEHEHLDTAP
jgi:hypothetical protein